MVRATSQISRRKLFVLLGTGALGGLLVSWFLRDEGGDGTTSPVSTPTSSTTGVAVDMTDTYGYGGYGEDGFGR